MEVRAALLEPIAVARHDLAELHERHVEGRRDHRDGTFEVRRRDADDRVPLPVQRHRSPDDLWIAAEEALPRAVADDRDGVGTRTGILIAHERAAELRRRAEHVEEVGGDDGAHDSLRLSARRDAERGVRPSGHAREHVGGALSHVEVVRDRARTVVEAARVRPIELHQLRFVADAGERSERQRLDGGEDGGVEPDPECERQHGNGCQSRLRAQDADGVSQISEERRHDWPSVVSHSERSAQRGGEESLIPSERGILPVVDDCDSRLRPCAAPLGMTVCRNAARND